MVLGRVTPIKNSSNTVKKNEVECWQGEQANDAISVPWALLRGHGEQIWTAKDSDMQLLLVSGMV